MRKTMHKLPILVFLTISLGVQGQPGPLPDDEVRMVLNLYLDGWATGDSTKVGKAMHSSCQLKSYINGKFNHVLRNKYLSVFKPHERESDTRTEVLDIDVTKNIASAKVRIVTKDNIFTDYMHLIRTDKGWFIVDKVAVREDK